MKPLESIDEVTQVMERSPIFSQTRIVREIALGMLDHEFIKFFTDETIDINTVNRRIRAYILLFLWENHASVWLQNHRKRFWKINPTNLTNSMKYFFWEHAEVNIQDRLIYFATQAWATPDIAKKAYADTF